jgi:SHS2 domain-containing protein
MRGDALAETRWSHFPHGSDIGIRGYGRSKEEAFEQAAIAMTAVITDPNTIEPRIAVKITCEGPDDEFLFVDWLNALIFEMATRNMLFSRFEVRLDGDRLDGEARGETTDVTRHQPAVEIKGATLTELAVKKEPTGTWVDQCVVDV